jgi:ABC-type transporter Mla subunit MlaD
MEHFINALANPELHKFIIGGGISLVAFYFLIKLVDMMFTYLTGKEKGTSETLKEFVGVLKLVVDNVNDTLQTVTSTLSKVQEALNESHKALENNTQALVALKDYVATQQKELELLFDKVNVRLDNLETTVDDLKDVVEKHDATSLPPSPVEANTAENRLKNGLRGTFLHK